MTQTVKKTTRNKEVNMNALLIPKSRCVARLKSKINGNKEQLLNDFKKNNKDYFTKLQTLQTSKSGKSGDALKKVEKLITDHKNKDGKHQELNNLKKDILRISDTGSLYLTCILEYIVTSLIKYGIDITLKDSKSQKAPKVNLSRFNSEENRNDLDKLSVSQLVKQLKAYETLVNTIENEVEKKEGKEPLSYESIIQKIFKKQASTYTEINGKRICCTVLTKQCLSSMINDFIDHIAEIILLVVKKISKSNTVMDYHIRSVLELTYLFNNTDGKQVLEDIDSLYEKNKKSKSKSKSK